MHYVFCFSETPLRSALRQAESESEDRDLSLGWGAETVRAVDCLEVSKLKKTTTF